MPIDPTFNSASVVLPFKLIALGFKIVGGGDPCHEWVSLDFRCGSKADSLDPPLSRLLLGVKQTFSGVIKPSTPPISTTF